MHTMQHLLVTTSFEAAAGGGCGAVKGQQGAAQATADELLAEQAGS